MAKLRGYDYEIVYKKGIDNGATDALSRAPSSELIAMTFFALSTELIERIRRSWETNKDCDDLLRAVAAGLGPSKFAVKNDILERGLGWIVVGRDDKVHKDILLLFHASTLGGHSGATATHKKVSSIVYWKGLKRDVREFVRKG